MDQQQLNIWFAGFYEGEGSISNDISNRNRLRVCISQNDDTPLKIGKNIWGGNIRNRTRITPKGKICNGNEWVLNHNSSLKFLNDIKPYMLIPYKINQLENAYKKLKEPWDKKFKCNFCDKVFADMSGRRRHEKNNHIEKGIKFSCEICKKTYNSRESMKRHIKINHLTSC